MKLTAELSSATSFPLLRLIGSLMLRSCSVKPGGGVRPDGDFSSSGGGLISVAPAKAHQEVKF